LALRRQTEPFNNDDLIDLWSGGRCMLTSLPFRETPVGSGQARRPFAPSLEGAIKRTAARWESDRAKCQTR
jgi:hypothetical protein